MWSTVYSTPLLHIGTFSLSLIISSTLPFPGIAISLSTRCDLELWLILYLIFYLLSHDLCWYFNDSFYVLRSSHPLLFLNLYHQHKSLLLCYDSFSILLVHIIVIINTIITIISVYLLVWFFYFIIINFIKWFLYSNKKWGVWICFIVKCA